MAEWQLLADAGGVVAEEAESPEAKTEAAKTGTPRGWMLIHGLAAACLYTAMKLGGVPSWIGGLFQGAGESTASGAASAAAVFAMTIVGIGYWASASLVRLIEVSPISATKKRWLKFSLPFAYVAAMFPVIIALQSAVSHHANLGTAATGSSHANPQAPIITSDAVQSGEGYSDSNFDENFLANIKTWLVNSTTERLRQEYTNRGLIPPSTSLSADAAYAQADGKKLAIIKLRFNFGGRFVYLIGISGAELHQVRCARNSDEDIPLSVGPCADKISDVFGARLRN